MEVNELVLKVSESSIGIDTALVEHPMSSNKALRYRYISFLCNKNHYNPYHHKVLFSKTEWLPLK